MLTQKDSQWRGLGLFEAFSWVSGSMKLRLRYALILMLGITSCEKPAGLDFNFQALETICFPDDNIYVTFKIIPKGGNDPYLINWYEPSGFQGEGPFSVRLTNDLLLDFEIQDSEGNSKRASHKIVKDTIDSLKYDYRNRYIGSYSCNVRYSYIDSVRYYFDTLAVTKPEGFRNVVISNTLNNWGMNYLDSNQFYGYHRGVTFSNDSIYFSESGPLGYYYTNTYTGVKLKTP